MKIYTKTGDGGQTSLFSGKRVSKDDIRIEAYGTIDELNSFVAQLISVLPAGFDQIETLVIIQNRLFTIGSNLATESTTSKIPDLKEEDIFLLENQMDKMEAVLPPLRSFILPGGSHANAVAHICRTVTRRAERRMVSLSEGSEVDLILIKYVNRLSDYFFMTSRYIAIKLGHQEVPWVARKD